MAMTTYVKPPCEVVVNKILPSVRGELVRILSCEHGMRQTEIAELLGITQASVSQYLNSSRGRDKLLLEIFPEIETDMREVAGDIVKDANSTVKNQISFKLWCNICTRIIRDDKFEIYLKNQNMIDECVMCYSHSRD